MASLRDLKTEILREGSDLWIDEDDVARIRASLPSEGSVTRDDLEILIELRREAQACCEAFDGLFFPILKEHLLRDQRISQAEHLLLLRMLYGGGGIDDAERRFIQELRDELTQVTPEFESLYRDAMREE